MKVQIKPDSINFEELKSKLEAQFPNYKFKVRSKNFLVAAKSGTIGSNIILRKNKILVVGSFPSMGLQMVFTLSLFLLGILIPLIIYFIAFHGKFKAIEKEIGDFVQKEYAIQ